MAEHLSVQESLDRVDQFALVARNAQVALVVEPLDSREYPKAEEAREKIAQQVFGYLTEVLDGVGSPYFVTYTRRDAQYIDNLATNTISELVWDRMGVFDISKEPKIYMTDTSEALAASFAYIASGYMREIKTPFFQAPSVRTTVPSPKGLADFVRIVNTVKDTTLFACEPESRHTILQRNEWRTAFAFWEANRRLAGTLSGNTIQ